MKTRVLVWSLVVLIPLSSWQGVQAGEDAPYTRQEVIYGRKDGMALTMDIFTPKKDANGAAVVYCVSGGWFSAHSSINTGFIEVFVRRGYTVFAVVHGSQPRFTIPEILQDMHRAVRFIRHNAAQYKIDPDRIGISGGSAGGHLSLMQGTAGDLGNKEAKDPIDRVSSRVQAVACFFPPTDFLNYGAKGEDAIGRGTLAAFKAPFDFRRYDPKTRAFERITDEPTIQQLGRQISPVNHATPDDAPTLIIHGDKDKLVPIQQAQIMIDKLKEVGVAAQLVVREGQVHGWKDMKSDVNLFADWFDRHLLKKTAK